ncbi:hypothetical protein [Sphingopyxis sp. 113P3]|nr:hypothetical protein [Sphingopyxis sp. 113P3]
MLSVKEHPDTAEVTLDVTLARLAIAFALVAFGLPLVRAALL